MESMVLRVYHQMQTVAPDASVVIATSKGQISAWCNQLGMRSASMTNRSSLSSDAFFRMQPHVVHSMSFPEDCILAAMYDIPVERPDGTKDIYTE